MTYLADTQAFQAFISEHRTWGEKIVDALQAVVKRLKDHSAGRQNVSQEATEALKLWENAYNQAKEAVKNAPVGGQGGGGAGKTNSNSNINYSVKGSEDILLQSNNDSLEQFTEKEISDIQAIERKSVNSFTSEEIRKTEKFAKRYWNEMGIKSPFFRSWFGDWRSKDRSKILTVNISNSKPYAAGKTANTDTGRIISWGSDFVRETRRHQRSGGIASSIIDHIPEIVENAILLDSVISEPSSKTKMPGTAIMHSFYARVKTGKNYAVIKLFAEEAVSLKTGVPFTRAYELKDIAIVATSTNGVLPVSGSLTDANVATIQTVADLFSVVKNKDKDFTSKPVNIDLINSDGTPKVFYHGTPNGDFTVFRDWQYFTESKPYADVYQEQGASSNGYKQTATKRKTYEVYLAPKKIFDTRNTTEKT